MPVVEATGVATTKRIVRPSVQAAMEQAAKVAYDEGVTDPETIKARILQAREQVKRNG